MDRITLINALLETAEWWIDETGFINRPFLWENSVTVTEDDYGFGINANGGIPSGDFADYQMRAWFLLFIIADLEYDDRVIAARHFLARYGDDHIMWGTPDGQAVIELLNL